MATGFGKTRIALIAIDKFLKANPGKSVLVSVPTIDLKTQWIEQTTEWGFFNNVKVEVINTIIKWGEQDFDLLILDEAHLMVAESFSKILKNIKYKRILCLTATMERLDGRHIILQKHAPIIDKVSVEEAVNNKWLAPLKEYLILIDVDLTEWIECNIAFQEHFSFFENNFDLAMKCVTDWKVRNKLSEQYYTGDDPKEKSIMNKLILKHAMGFSRMLQKRKSFISNHPKKLEICHKIIENRLDKKILTFSSTVANAEKIKYGNVLSSKQTKKNRRITLDEFKTLDKGILNSSKALDAGVDIPGLNVGIIMNINSSKITKTQRTGRIIRFSPNKEAELFTLVIKGTVEEEWFRRSNSNSKYITLDEMQLINLLEGKEIIPKKNKETGLRFRF